MQARPFPLAKKKPISIEIVHEDGAGFVVTVFTDGETMRTPITKTKAKRKPVRPQRRLGMDRTRKKRF